MASGDILIFGGFRLSASERQLSHDGHVIRLGSRALDILHCLVREAGNIVRNEDLMREVWGAVHVEEVSLRVHISELRKALGQFSDAMAGEGLDGVLSQLEQIVTDANDTFKRREEVFTEAAADAK